MQALRVRGLVVGVAVAVVVAGGCSSSSPSSSGGTSTTASAGSSTTGSGQSPAQATQQITQVWEAFFGPHGSASQIQGVTPALESTYAKSKTSGLGAGSSAQVKSVHLLDSSQCSSNGVPAPCASVTYNILIKGSVALPNAQGYATEEGGKWLVAKATFCALESLESGGSSPPGC